MIRITNQRQIKTDINRLIKRLNIDSEVFIRRIALEVFKGVIQKNPVDTGFSRYNWNVTPNSSDTNVYGGSRENFAENKAEGAQRAAARNSEQIWALDRARHYFVTNNVYYIKYLEEGSAGRPGYHMAKRTINEVQARLRALKRELFKK